MRSIVSIFWASFMLLSACNSSLFNFGSKVKQGELKVFENNHTFSISEIKLSLNETFSYTVSNGLDDESFEFVLLKNGEDPIFVQHLLQQKEQLPESYYIYKSETIKPGAKLKVTFDAPSEPGLYYYVALTDAPKESLFGTLHVESLEPLKVEGDLSNDQLN